MQDFIIIGGGIAGLSAASRLAPLGQVTVLEAEANLGYHASGRSAALFEANYGAPSTVEFNKASEAHHRAANVLTPRGFMVVGRDGDASFDADCIDLQVTEITRDEAVGLFPILDPCVTRAAFTTDCWDIDTDLLLQGFAKTARQHGATIRTGTPVTEITRTSDGWEVQTPTDRLRAKTLINAAGAWADEIAKLAGVAPIGLTPMRRSMARIPAPEGHDITAWPMVLGAGETWYAKPDAGALIVSPADEDPTTPHDAWADDMTLAEGIARYEDYVTAPVTRLISSWAGLRSFAPDRQLVLGRASDDPEFVWCAGQGGYGMQSAPAVAETLAALVNGTTPPVAPWVIDATSPTRIGR